MKVKVWHKDVNAKASTHKAVAIGGSNTIWIPRRFTLKEGRKTLGHPSYYLFDLPEWFVDGIKEIDYSGWLGKLKRID